MEFTTLGLGRFVPSSGRSQQGLFFFLSFSKFNLLCLFETRSHGIALAIQELAIVDQASLKLREPFALASHMLGSKACATALGECFLIYTHCMCGPSAIVRMWMEFKGHLVGVVSLSFHHVSSGNLTQVIGLGNREEPFHSPRVCLSYISSASPPSASS